MNTTAAAQEHRTLVTERANLVTLFQEGRIHHANFESRVAKLDSRIGHLAQAFNPRIADKAAKWLKENA